MTYTHITLLALVLSIFNDLLVFKTHLTSKKVFWTSYSIILPFQLLTNWWLTSRNIVMYSDNAIIGFRIASAPIEDLGFGFSLVLSVLTLWIVWGRKGIQRY
jgi:lycopene cyclase domain-containing protein